MSNTSVPIEKEDYRHTLHNVGLRKLQRQQADKVHADFLPDQKIFALEEGKVGFYLDLSTSLQTESYYLKPAGMVIGDPQNIRGLLIFPTFLPSTGGSQSSCQLGGHALIQGINFRTGGGVLLDYSNMGSPFYNGGVYDLNSDGTADEYDLEEGYKRGVFTAALDTQIVGTVDLEKLYPYTHDGKLKREDVWLRDGIVLPSAMSLGNTGIPGDVGILETNGLIVVQPTFIEVPSLGRVGALGPASEGKDDNENTRSDPARPEADEEILVNEPPPSGIPFQSIKNAAKFLGFHEVTE